VLAAVGREAVRVFGAAAASHVGKRPVAGAVCRGVAPVVAGAAGPVTGGGSAGPRTGGKQNLENTGTQVIEPLRGGARLRRTQVVDLRERLRARPGV
jgi:hypothetical protein